MSFGMISYVRESSLKEGLFYPGLGSEGQRRLRPDCDTTRSGGASKRISTSGRAFACDFGKY
jgi:hypothetical protein